MQQALAPARIIHLDGSDETELEQAIAEADIAILRGDLDDRFLNRKSLRWIHCDHAGIEKSARRSLIEAGMIISGSAGRSAPALAEHAFLFMLAFSYRFPRFLDAQRQHQWGVEGQDQLRGLVGKTVGILGMGHTGSELAYRCKAFGMRVLAYRRRAELLESVDQLYAVERGQGLGELLAESDYVVLALSLSDQTHHLLGTKEFGQMKESAFLVNMARGSIIDEGALLAALEKGHIAGAGLDTFSTEPLPSDSPLWDLPNVLITPHVTPQIPDRTGASLDIICENIRRYRAGESLLNTLNLSDVYTRS
ncbi:MAG: D-2-hydroxyacid dehydrogenase [Candidatus Latescibacterota bacterium]